MLRRALARALALASQSGSIGAPRSTLAEAGAAPSCSATTRGPSPLTAGLASSAAPSAGEPAGGAAGGGDSKLHLLKCTKASPSPVSQAVACMLSRDQMPRAQLVGNMDALCKQLLQDVSAFSSTELSAFAEACRQVGYVNRDAFGAMLAALAPRAASVACDELPSLLWAGARLAADSAAGGAPAAAPAQQQQQQQQQQSAVSEGDIGRSVPVPRHDGVAGAVNSSRIAGLPGVLEFVLGASQVLTAEVEDLSCEELPVVAAALADMELRDPFLLTAVAEAAMDRRRDLSEGELVALVSSFAAMGRHFFDSRVLDQLAGELVARAEAGSAAAAGVERAAAQLAAINHRNARVHEFLAARGGGGGGGGPG